MNTYIIMTTVVLTLAISGTYSKGSECNSVACVASPHPTNCREDVGHGCCSSFTCSDGKGGFYTVSGGASGHSSSSMTSFSSSSSGGSGFGMAGMTFGQGGFQNGGMPGFSGGFPGFPMGFPFG